GGGADEIERVASDECEFRVIARFHNLGIIGFDNFGGVDDERRRSLNSRKKNSIAGSDPLQLTEKRIPVTRDSGITVAARQRCSRYMSCARMQRGFLCTLKNHYGNTNMGDLQFADDVPFTQIGTRCNRFRSRMRCKFKRFDSAVEFP